MSLPCVNLLLSIDPFLPLLRREGMIRGGQEETKLMGSFKELLGGGMLCMIMIGEYVRCLLGEV